MNIITIGYLYINETHYKKNKEQIFKSIAEITSAEKI